MNAKTAVSATPRLRWYKGNLHCHTYTSDGRAFPEQALARYREAGYDFCAITNHNRLGRETDFWRKVADGATDMAYEVSRRNFDIYRASCPWAEVRDNDGATEVRIQPIDVVRARCEVPGKFLVLPGVEISRANSIEQGANQMHMVYVGLDAIDPVVESGYFVQPADSSDMSAIIRQARGEVATLADGLGNPPHLCFLCHPQWRFYDVVAQNVIDNPEVRFFEVCNNGASFPPVGLLPDDGRYPERLWDAVNAVRARAGLPLLYAVANDDCHFYPGTGTTHSLGFGTAFTVVRAASLTPAALSGAMERGDFYASNGVMLDDVRFDSETGELTVSVRPRAGVSHTVSFIATKRDADTEVVQIVHVPWSGSHDWSGRPERTLPVYSNEIGATVREVRGGKGEALAASYTLAPDDLYVRARVVSDEQAPYYAAGNTAPMHPKFATAWTQPYRHARQGRS